MTDTRPCRACGTPSRPQHDVAIRDHAAHMYRCPSCDMFFVGDPTWLDEAYADPIAKIDVGLASRCVNMAWVLEAVVRAERLARRRLLDYGGGYGLLTRLARDRGLDMRHYDPHTTNLFAQGFEGDVDDRFGCISMIEVLEHLSEPAEVLATLSRRTDHVLVSTVLVPRGMTSLTDWWYLGAPVGQHISFYSEKALGELGRRCGYRVTSNGTSVHLFHRRPINFITRSVFRDLRLSLPIAGVLRVRDRASSLRDADGAFVTEQLVTRQLVARGVSSSRSTDGDERDVGR